MALDDSSMQELGVGAVGARNKLLRQIAKYHEETPGQAKDANPSSVEGHDGSVMQRKNAISIAEQEEQDETHVAQRNSDESLRMITKDSIEDLRSDVPRSPRSAAKSAPPTKTEFAIPEVPGRVHTSPKKLQRKKLTLRLNGAEFDIEKKEKKRPLSPFTRGGMLRRMMSPVPPSAPAALTEFGPTIADEVEQEMRVEKECAEKRLRERAKLASTTRAERGGRMLLGFLGKRVGRAE